MPLTFMRLEGTLFRGALDDKEISLDFASPPFQFRGFLGHAGWTKGQLDAELNQGSWVLSGCLAALKGEPSEIDWCDLLCQERPELGFLANAPDDTSLN